MVNCRVTLAWWEPWEHDGVTESEPTEWLRDFGALDSNGGDEHPCASAITRLDPDTNMSGLPIMVPVDDGGYVEYNDHQAEVEKLRAEQIDPDDAMELARFVQECRFRYRSRVSQRTIEAAHRVIEQWVRKVGG